ncbi:MAG: flagellar brake protein [Betaproteobacteria bacterium]|nr:flagellar brake protein [Betaproteobacteria bacterium]
MSSPTHIRFERQIESPEISQYLVRSPREILSILRQLAEKRALLLVYPNGRHPSALLSIITVSESDQALYLDISNDPELNGRLLSAEQSDCDTQLDRVEIRFQIGALTKASAGGGEAMRCAIPQALLRLQRRESFRLVTSVVNPIRCFISIPASADKKAKSYEARVLNISVGGVALVVPEGLDVAPDVEFKDCRIDLPDTSPIVVTLKARNIFRITQVDGTEQVRAGFEFVNLKPAQDSTIQRYILRIERERAASS